MKMKLNLVTLGAEELNDMVSRTVQCRSLDFFWSVLALNLASHSMFPVYSLTLCYHVSKTAVPLHMADEIFNDAWVSLLHQPESGDPGVPGVPGPTGSSTPSAVWPSSAAREPLRAIYNSTPTHTATVILLHFSASAKREIIKNGVTICTGAQRFK